MPFVEKTVERREGKCMKRGSCAGWYLLWSMDMFVGVRV